MLRKSLLSFALTGLVVGLAGCGSVKDIAGASTAVDRFHDQLDKQDYDAIFIQADQRFRDASPQPDFLAFMNAIHTKLGKVTDATRRGFFVNYTTSGTQIRLNYATKFAGGNADEEFVWAKNGESYTLVGYHINSMALITK